MGGCLSKSHLTPEQQYALSVLNGSVHGSKHGSKLGSKFGSKYGSKHGDPVPVVPAAPVIPDFGLGQYYRVEKLLGEGGTGQTWLCVDSETGEQVAIKFIKRPIPKVLLPMIYHEIKIQAQLGDGHCSLVNVKAMLLTSTFLGIVMEFAAGGNLTSYVADRWTSTMERGGLFLDEDEARLLFKQFMAAVEFLHANHVAHRDLKLDNIVMDGRSPPRIKLCDFGFAKNWDDSSNMLTQIGTPVYMSPQLISTKKRGQGYDATKADVWACGVLLFVMLLGMFPFEHQENPDPNTSAAHIEVWLQQIRGSWRENQRVAEYAKRLSPECLDLLDRMFELDEAKRPTIEAIKASAWYTKPLPPAYQAVLDELEVQQRLNDGKLQAGQYQSSKRDEALEATVNMAGTTFMAGDKPFTRIPLSKLQKNYSIIAPRHNRKSLLAAGHMDEDAPLVIEENGQQSDGTAESSSSEGSTNGGSAGAKAALSPALQSVPEAPVAPEQVAVRA